MCKDLKPWETFYTKPELEDMLPEVGTRLVKTPHLHKSLGIETPRPQLCTVIQVNRAHRVYTVQFDNGLRESFKVPEGGRQGRDR